MDGWERTCRERERAFAADVRELDHVSCEERAGDANNTQDDLLYACSREVKIST